jgi:hypothetical protein
MTYKFALVALSAATLLTIPACRSTPSADCVKLGKSYLKGDRIVQHFYHRFDFSTGTYLGSQAEMTEWRRAMEQEVLPELTQLSISEPKLREVKASLIGDYQKFVGVMKTHASTLTKFSDLNQPHVRVEGSTAWVMMSVMCPGTVD